MRILFDSRDRRYKSPFGCVRRLEECRLSIDIPLHCKTTGAFVHLQQEGGSLLTFPLQRSGEHGAYEIYTGTFRLTECGLYYYYFHMETENGPFRLFKQGQRDTNIEEGALWQLTCFDETYDTPAAFKGKVMYQIFPDRFYKQGECDLKDKLQPFTIHERLDNVPCYLPDEGGRVWNNDFFGGNLKGIEEKLPYLQSLGVSVLYLNPIFMAFSNHRYDTADYMRIDPMLGTEQDFVSLCTSAHRLGMRVILDGVFSHTGSDSIYFDRENRFGNGACHNPNSPYRQWYQFSEDGSYTSWWGIDTLPCVNELNDSYLDYIICGEHSVVAKWMNLGADGFRLDVADELPDEFIVQLKKRIKQLKPDSLIIGEVWEDASNKESYGVKRKYFTQSELDSVMNYPYKNAIIQFIKGSMDASGLSNAVMTIAENYPKPVLDCLMNSLSTHDTVRILTELGHREEELSRGQRAGYRLPPGELDRAVTKAKAAVFLQYTLPGCPCIYYGDEAGMEGFEDPFNRRYVPWDNVNQQLLAFYREMGHIKNSHAALQTGAIEVTEANGGLFVFRRLCGGEELTMAVTVGTAPVPLPWPQERCLITENCGQMEGGICLHQYGFAMVAK